MLKRLDENEAELLGLMVGDGCTSSGPVFTNNSTDLFNYFKDLWECISKRNEKSGETRLRIVNTNGNDVYHLHLKGFIGFFRKYTIYNKDKTKRVPRQVLNAPKTIKMKFLDGYNKADGLKAGYGIYKFKNFKSNSACLAQGLIYLIKSTTNQNFNINTEHKYDEKNRFRIYYSINLSSDTRFSATKSIQKYKTVLCEHGLGKSQRQICRDTKISRGFIRKVINHEYVPTGIHHKQIESNLVKKIIEHYDYNGWFYDLETESGKFHAGVGLGRIHNSPRRGKTFVTRKISLAVGKIKAALDANEPFEPLTLGNMNAKRDWGHAKDYVRGMVAILDKPEPKDYILATGEMHSVREFVKKAFAVVDLNIVWSGSGIDEVGYVRGIETPIVKIDERYFRPSEVEQLLGDPLKAKQDLNWEPEISFDELVETMVKSDLLNKTN